ncbi:MAG TPA: M13 family metallopeptidase N-terminal domain-containing protein, partial [Ferruginibacter sp.]|nr:M13 family metallopeptidase N-terminal domain-containing protein [Ferruginibacter sp.]
MRNCFVILTIASLIFGQSAIAQSSKKKKFIDVAYMDQSVKPGDNFYLYVNGNWIKKTPIPGSKTRWGSFDILTEQSSEALRGLLEDAAKSPGNSDLMRRVGDFYASGMDSLAIEARGFDPIKPYLTEIDRLSSKPQISAGINYLRSHAISSPLYRIGVGQDARRVTNYIISIGQGGTSLPDRDYYLKEDKRSATIRNEYLNYVSTLFKLCGADEATAKQNAQTILNIETAIARAQMSRTEMRDPVKLYNKFSFDDFEAKMPHMDWVMNLSQLGYTNNTDSVIVSNPRFMVFEDSLFNAIPVNDWRVYLKWNVMRDAAPYLSSSFVDANFAFNKV